MRAARLLLFVPLLCSFFAPLKSMAEEGYFLGPDENKFLGKETPYLKNAQWDARLKQIQKDCSPEKIKNKEAKFAYNETYLRSRLDRYLFTPADKLISFTTKQFTEAEACTALSKSRAIQFKKMTVELIKPYEDTFNYNLRSAEQNHQSADSLARNAILKSSCMMKCISSKIITYWGKASLSGYVNSHYLSNENRPEMSLVTGQGMCRHYADIFNFIARNVFNAGIPEKYRPEFRYVSTDDHAFVRLTQKELGIDAYLDPIDSSCKFYDVQAHSVSIAHEAKELMKKGADAVEDDYDAVKDWLGDLLKPKKPAPNPKSPPKNDVPSQNTCTSAPTLPTFENACERELRNDKLF